MSNFPKTDMLFPLISLGPVIELDFSVDSSKFESELDGLASKWRPYNPRKNISRYGLSLTSLNGDDSGVPDLDSLKEFNQANSTNYLESDFKTPTEAFQKLTALHPVMNFFEGHLGRSHIIKLDSGGFFPPHRDAYIEPSCFRIFIPCQNCQKDQFVFLVNDKQVIFEPYKVYFIDTRLEHSTFSFANHSTQVILNVAVSEESVLKTLKKVKIR